MRRSPQIELPLWDLQYILKETRGRQNIGYTVTPENSKDEMAAWWSKEEQLIYIFQFLDKWNYLF
jgi:hypothetical protein